MKWNEMLRRSEIRAVVCVLLAAAVLLSLWAPGVVFRTAQMEDPTEGAEIREITALSLGDAEAPQAGDGDGGENTAAQEAEEPDSPEEPELPEELEPPEEPEQTDPEQTQPEQPGDGASDPGTDGGEGQEDSNRGEEGGAEAALDLAMVMTWYQYGTQPKTIVCPPSSTVEKNLNTAQLADDTLRYRFDLTGGEAGNVRIASVQVKAGDGPYRETAESGEIAIELPGADEGRNYTFRIEAVRETWDAQGGPVEQTLIFTYVLHCSRGLDLDLELRWTKKDGTAAVLTCAADGSASGTVESGALAENLLRYSLELTGPHSRQAEIVRAEYTTASGGSGALDAAGGTLAMAAAPASDRETYDLSIYAALTGEDGTRQTVTYHITLLFQVVRDVRLAFRWLEGGRTPVTLLCEPNRAVSTDIRHNQLSAGAVDYEMTLEGADGADARILSISYQSASGGGTLKANGALPLELPAGYTSNTYTITVKVLAGGTPVTFTVMLNYAMDVCLEMRYTVDGESRTVVCENGKTVPAEAVYDDQLPGGLLRYAMDFTGADSAGLRFLAVTCYQSGSGKTVYPDSEGEIQLLLKDGKTGENTFRVTAADDSGRTYAFTVNIPYKHRGENRVRIETNLRDGQTVINEAKTNLTVSAWTEDADGAVIGYIPATGSGTKLIVKLDGRTVPCDTPSGTPLEYTLWPENPKVGDSNTHTLYIYAEDEYGNYGETTILLNGQRRETGQTAGTAYVYVDLTVLGLGRFGPVQYTVLADEPVSYVIAKAVMGMDTGEPFGAASDTFGWSGRYAGTLDSGFYLQSLNTGYSANALEGGSWPGASETEVLAAIDARFGTGTGLATLWRCLYRNGLNKSSGSGGSFGEFDYTSGSGWMYAIGGSTYYPGQSMSAVCLQDGDVLTLRYTLAYGWDVGGGSPGYGSTVGYCVTALNGSFQIQHQMERIEGADGAVRYVCHCCGLEEDCAHAHQSYKDLGDGTHISNCEDCKTSLGDPIPHTWEEADGCHRCADCGAEEAHAWKETGNTATCTESGVRTLCCMVCGAVKEEPSPARGHTLDNRWNYTAASHYQKCSTCGAEVNRGAHQYVYDAELDDYACVICQALHDWDVGCTGTLSVAEATCQSIVYHCSGCGLNLTKYGTFDEFHVYLDGRCTVCGKTDPSTPPPDPGEPEPSEPDDPGDNPPEP